MENLLEDDEYLDLVDQEDQVVGKKLRSEIYAEGLSNFRVVNAFVVNSKGEIFVPRRTAAKRIFPLCLDMSVGGHVASGETYEEAFQRETAEELRIDTSSVPVRLLGYITPQDFARDVFMKVWEIKSDETPDYNRADFVEHFWLPPDQLIKRIQAGEPAKDDLLMLAKLFYGN